MKLSSDLPTAQQYLDAANAENERSVAAAFATLVAVVMCLVSSD
ncbi:hypothetical protein [Mesorhizobium sp. Arg314]